MSRELPPALERAVRAGTMTKSHADLLAEAIDNARKEGADSVHMSKMFGADRIAFIREAAIEFAITRDDAGDQDEDSAECWRRAKALWDAKPEDC